MLLALVSLASALFQTQLTIRTAKVEITPPEPLPLGGYTARQGRVMDAGGDPLYARCILFSSGDWKVALVSAEMLTIPDSLAREVRKHIPPDIHLFLAATHTHSAPDSQMLNERMTFSIPGIATYKSRWLRWYAEKIAQCVEEATKPPVWASIAHIDRLYTDEFAIPLNRGRREGADPDVTATVLYEHLRSLRAMNMPLIAEYAAHPVFFGAERNQTSGDWPGRLSAHYEERYHVDAMDTLVGAIGDVSPRADGATPEARIGNFVSRFETEQRAARDEPVWHPGDALADVSEPIHLDPVTPHPKFGADYKIPQALAQTLAEKFAPNEASITAIRFGSLAIVGIPGEPTSHLGRRIREAGIAMGFRSVLVISHVNGWIGYILDARDYAQGGYEADLSFYGPREGDRVVDAVLEALKKLMKIKA